MRCSEHARAASLPLEGTATVAERWLLVQVGGAWGRDAVTDTELPEEVRTRLAAFDGRVLFIRSSGRSTGTTVVHAVSTEAGGSATQLSLGSLADLPAAELGAGAEVAEPIVLVCTHGRRDACCARAGVPLHDALQESAGDRVALWQSSHQGGHRFAANVIVLPWGIQLGRVEPAEAREVAELLLAGRIPLHRYRGRTLYAPPVQAAEIAVRRELGLDRVDDVRLDSVDGDVVRFGTSGGDAVVVVKEIPGPRLPPSCGAKPENTVLWSTRVESVA